MRQLQRRLSRELNQPRKSKPRWPRWVVALSLVGLLLVLGWIKRDIYFNYRFQRAEQAVTRGDYAVAAATYADLQRSHPDWKRASEALLLTADLQLLRLKQPQQALLQYLLLIRDYPAAVEVATALRRGAEIYQRQGEPREALVLWQQLLDHHPVDAASIQYRIADIYAEIGNYAQALIEFDNLLQGGQGGDLQAEAEYRIGQIHLIREDYPAALSALQRVADQWPRSPSALEARLAESLIFERQGELLKAEDLLRQLEQQYPHSERLQQRLDKVRQRMEQKKKAL